MKSLTFDPRPMDQLDHVPQAFFPEWLWEGYVARGNITLLTSRWKAGKTTLVSGFLRSLEKGGTFLDLHCAAAAALIVSEELPAHWSARQRAIPIGPHVRLLSRPFHGRPSPEGWDELVRLAEVEQERGMLDLFVVDPLATFLPGRSDCDAATLLDLLNPLRRLAGSGVAVLVLHHPRKEEAEEGSRARGSGALLGYVDVILELDRSSRLPGDACRRRILALSRHPVAPPSVVYEWKPGTSEFQVVVDVLTTRYKENWPTVERILSGRKAAATHRELLADWPEDQPAPSERQLYEWLSKAAAENLVVRKGAGTKNKPYRFRLPAVEEVERDMSAYPTTEELDIPPRLQPGFEWPDDFSDDERRILGAPPRKKPPGES